MELKTFIIFFAGAGVGALGMHFYEKAKYEHQLDMEIEKVNKVFYEERKRLYEEAEKNVEASEKAEKEIKTFKHEIAKQNYDAYFREVEAPVEKSPEPRLITANEFATDRAHDKITLTYYINANVVCEEDEVLENNVEELIGTEWRNNFHEGEEGVVYVRNEKLGADYEVLLDESDADYVRENLGFGE